MLMPLHRMQGDTTMTMMSFDILLLAAAALSTVVILFSVVIVGGHQGEHQHAKAGVPHQPHRPA